MEERTRREELEDALKNGGMAGRYKAAAAVAEERGDREMADCLRTLSAQMDFDDNTDKVEAIEKTKAQLNSIIRERKKQHADLYANILSDDEIVRMANGEVDQEDHYDPAWLEFESRFTKGGLFDPAIFGGTGKAPVIQDGKLEQNPYGKGMGYFRLPVYVIDKEKAYIIAQLLGWKTQEVKEVADYSTLYVTGSEDASYPAGTLIPVSGLSKVKDINKIKTETGGDLIYRLLNELNYPTHPEKLAFCVIPVVCPKMRPMAIQDRKPILASLNRRYETIIIRSYAYEMLEKLDSPEFLLHTKGRELQNAVDDLMGKWGDSEKYDSFAAIAKSQDFFPEARCQSILSARHRLSRYVPVDIGEPEEIVSLGLYPETIKVIGEDGKEFEETPQGIYDHNWNSFYDWRNNAGSVCDVEEPGMPTEEEKEKIEAFDREYDYRYSLVRKAVDKSIDERDLVVKEDPATGMYISA